MEPKFINFFKFLEDKEGKKTPLSVKLLNPKQFEITPEDLDVKGDVTLNFSEITSLPDGLKVGGNLELVNTPITSLPKDLKVKGDFYLSYSKITSLPDGLEVGGHFHLEKTPITSLPKDLKIRGNLYLSNTKITSLPKDLKVGGDLYLYNTPLPFKTEAEIRQMAPNIKGKIIGLNTQLIWNPNSLTFSNI